MNRDLGRLLRPKSIAIVGGGAWGASVIVQCRKMGFTGDLWAVHPKRAEVEGVPSVPEIKDLPGVPDAVFLGVNRVATVAAVAQLSRMGAGGAVCFASGFLEAQAESGDGADLQEQLLSAAGEMPVLGPNCYGFINYLDGALLWPDQHGGQACTRGVAILTQSSNMAINLTMQARGLPVAYVVTAGNQAQTGLAEIAAALLQDDRVTALGLHIEGVGDIRALEQMAATARHLGKPVVALKVGKSEQARAAAVSHTASLAGSDAGGQALLERLGIARVNSLPALLESLKLLHFAGRLCSNRIASLSCSGGEASLMADTAMGFDVAFPVLTEGQHSALRAALGPMVALANPLDYHTYIWGDAPAMARTFTAMAADDLGACCIVTDFPRADRCDTSAWDCVIEAAGLARAQVDTPLLLVATLPEAMSEEMAARIIAAGCIPMCGLDDTLAAISAAAWIGSKMDLAQPVLLPGAVINSSVLSEAAAKAALSNYGVQVPQAVRVTGSQDAAAAAERFGYPVVLKGEGAAHKSEAGLVRLNLMDLEAVRLAAEAMPSDAFLLEAMVTDSVAELLVGVTRDAAHGFVLTLAAGGVLTELLADSASMLIPATKQDILRALDGLRISKLLNGYRGKPAADRAAIVTAILALQDYVVAHADRLEEVEINPLICGAAGAVAADALIRIGESK